MQSQTDSGQGNRKSPPRRPLSDCVDHDTHAIEAPPLFRQRTLIFLRRPLPNTNNVFCTAHFYSLFTPEQEIV